MECLACELLEHPERVPGGRVATIGHWVVEHCVGPLGVGTMIVKPLRHVVHVADLDRNEAAELGPVLARVAQAVTLASSEGASSPSQVYVCLWSHALREPGHIHFVVQPVTEARMLQHDAYGPALQVRMFEAGEPMDSVAMAAAADRVRSHLRRDSRDIPAR